MGLFDRLFKKPSPQSVTPTSDSAPLLVDLVDVPLGGDETLYVVGESYRQDALWQLVGGTREEGVRVECVAQLVPEPDNPHDRNAIAVFIKGEHVGYLSRSDAAAYLDGLTHLIKESPNGHVTLHGWICGGGLREDGLGRLGVFLDHDPEDFGVVDEPPPHRTLADLPKGYGFRTGFSEARSTDLEDDSYDLSWFDDLSQSVPTAIAQLKTLLATVDDPIDRHYMYAELEHRLYGARFAFASALEEYDEACRQHDAAMDEIRAALFAKFGRLPILDTYRQAGVRCQQAKDGHVGRSGVNGSRGSWARVVRPPWVPDSSVRPRIDERSSTMAGPERMTVEDVVAHVLAGEHGDFVREAVALVARELMEAEISAEVGAAHGEVSAERRTHRNGYRPRGWETRVGEIELMIPRKRQGTAYFPSFLEPRRRSEQAIVAVVLEAYVNGVSTRKVDRLVEQLGIQGMSKDRVSALCRALDEQVGVFRERELEGEYPYLWLDAKQLKVRDGGHVRSKALVIAYAVHESGRREVIGLDLGEVESEAFWREFLLGLVKRGLAGVRLVISDQHEGLRSAIARVLSAPWQRCTVHFVRNMHQHCRPAQRGLVSAALREIFNAEGGEQARQRVGEVIARLKGPMPKVAALLEQAEEDLLAFYCFPAAHWTKLRSTNPLERVNREIGRRADVVGIFPNDNAAIRLAGALLIEQNDEWLVGRRYLSAESLALVLVDEDEPAETEEVLALEAA